MTACQHPSMTPSAEHPDYSVCQSCGSFRSRIAPPPEEVYTDSYWSHERNHSTLQEQVWNCNSHLENGISKNDFLLQCIDVEDRSAALEIGCAPGALLGRLKRDAGFEWVVGVDLVMADAGVRDAVRTIAIEAGGEPYDLYPWVFPDEALWAYYQARFSLILASDCFEHSHEPEAFLAECARLLKPGGQLLLMLPLVDKAQVIEMPERMWEPTEHVWLHAVGNLCAMLGEAGFRNVTLSQWTPGHECVAAWRVA